MNTYMKRILIALMVLLTAALVMVGCSGEEETSGTKAQQIKVYWNVDRDSYYDAVNKMSMRGKAGDHYRVRFAVDGEQLDLFVPTTTMMDTIDSMRFMGLSVDENNVVTGVYKPHEFTGGLAAYEYYVISIDGEKLLCNNTANGRGLPLKLKINDNTQIYDVGGADLLAGLPGQLTVGARIYAINGLDGYVSHIYIMPPFQMRDVYWNVERQYNTTSKSSTRERDALGYFNIEFVLNGETKILRTKSIEVIDKIDGFATHCMMLEFDEEGLISDAIHAKYATGGATVASWFHVLRLDKAGESDNINIVADGFYAEKFSGSDKGNSVQATYANNCKIYDMSGTGAYMGQETELRVGDQIHGLSNADGDVCLIFIVSRPREMNLYYNLERKWDNNAKVSTRSKASDGYYYFTMSVDGKDVRLKTQDPEIVKTIDGRAAKVLGLELDGNIITGAYAPGKVYGANKTLFDYTEVTAVEGDVITATRNGNVFTAKLDPNCEIWNVSSLAGHKGEATKIQVGDQIYGLGDMEGVAHNIYVVSRTLNSPVYWNLDRAWDSKAKVSKREPAEDGYYYIKLAQGTKTVTYKTKSKALVDKLDSFVAVALTASGDRLTSVYKYDCAKGYSGGGFASWATVKSVSGRTVVASDSKGSYTGTMASNCPVYNVSGDSAVPVTKTSLRVGDRIHGIKNSKGEVVVIYVVNRPVYAELYYNVERMWDDAAKASTRTPDENGWYWFTMAVNGKQVQLKTKSTIVVNTIDERAARVLGLELKGDEILAAYKPGNVETSKNTVFDYMEVTGVTSNGVITAVRAGKTVTATLSKKVKVYNVSNAAKAIGEFTTVEVGDTIYGLGTGKNAVNYVYVTKRVPKLATKTEFCPVCQQEALWTAWDGKTDLTNGHWYLTESVNQTACKNILKDSTVCLDLCGFEINGADTLDRMLNIYGTMNIMDSGETGKIIANFANETGRTGSVFYVQSSKENGYGTLNLYSGTLTATGLTKQGGVGGVSNVFHMYGGALIGGTAAKGGNLYVEALGKVSIYDGTVTGGSADFGSDIYTRAGITLGGNTQIGNLYLESGKTVTIDNLAETASIGVTLQDTYGVVATGATEANAAAFHAADDLQVAYADGQLVINPPVAPHAEHCICGGLGNVGDHTCLETMPVWEPWAGTWVDGGYYYLTDDYELSNSMVIEEGKTLNLCLNGFDLIGKSNVTRIFNAYGTVNLCDHADENGNYAGDVISNYEGTNTQTGRVFYVQNKNGAAFNLFGGNLRSNSTTAKGGIGGVAKACSIYAGTLNGTEVTTSGGVLQLDGGTVSIYGGTFTGGDIYANGTLVLGGKMTIEQVTLPAGRTITLADIASDASVGVTMETVTGVFATNAVEESAQAFCPAENLYVVYTDGTLMISETPEIETPDDPAAHADHCICAGLGAVGDHTCSESVPAWEPWTGTWVDGGYYYLTEDYPVSATIKIDEGKSLNLCLNGFDMIGGTNVNRVFNVFGILNICDHKTEDGTYQGDVTCNYDPANGDIKTGGVFYVQNRSTAALNLFGGNLKLTTKLKNGGVGGVTATVNLYDGALVGTKVSGDGGVLMLEHNNAKVNLYGGMVSGGEATNGGNIYVKYGTLTINGATVSGGIATNAGGSIRVQADANLKLISGKITGGDAKGNGGNVYSLGNVEITGGTVENGKAASGKIGGNLYASGGTLSIRNATITGGTATNGGNIAIKIAGVVISDCVISGGTADLGADIYFEKDGATLQITGCGAVAVYVAAGTLSGDVN